MVADGGRGQEGGSLWPAMTSLQRWESKRPQHLMTVLDVPITAAPGWCPALQQRSHRTLGVVIPRAGPGSQAWAGRCSRSAKVSAKVAAKVTRDPDTAARQPPAETTTSSSRGGGLVPGRGHLITGTQLGPPAARPGLMYENPGLAACHNCHTVSCVVIMAGSAAP